MKTKVCPHNLLELAGNHGLLRDPDSGMLCDHLRELMGQRYEQAAGSHCWLRLFGIAGCRRDWTYVYHAAHSNTPDMVRLPVRFQLNAVRLNRLHHALQQRIKPRGRKIMPAFRYGQRGYV